MTLELNDPDEYDAYLESGCPLCGGDVGVSGVFGFCENEHLLQVERAP